jgi:hypothetical protein
MQFLYVDWLVILPDTLWKLPLAYARMIRSSTLGNSVSSTPLLNLLVLPLPLHRHKSGNVLLRSAGVSPDGKYIFFVCNKRLGESERQLITFSRAKFAAHSDYRWKLMMSIVGLLALHLLSRIQ